MSKNHHAHGMSLEGKTISYLKNKFSQGTTELLVLPYNCVQGANMVHEKGKARTFFCDLKKLMESHPSASVADLDGDDNELLTPEVCEALESGSKKRKAAVVAMEKMRKGPIPEDSEEDPEEDSEEDSEHHSEHHSEEDPEEDPEEDSVDDPPPRAPTSKCVVCMEEQAIFAVKPCGHVCCCDVCIERMALVPKCPVCNQNSEGFMQLFFP